MSTNLHPLLAIPTICAALKQAWQDSQPGLSTGHEEGGFILRDTDGTLTVVRWPRGDQSEIILPDYCGGKVGEYPIRKKFLL
jgi:hypothetical protein